MPTVIVYGDIDDGHVIAGDATSWANLDVAGASLPSPVVNTSGVNGSVSRFEFFESFTAEQVFFSFDTSGLIAPTAASLFFNIGVYFGQSGDQTIRLLDHNWTAPLAVTDYIASGAHGDHTTLGDHTTDGTTGYKSISLSSIASIDLNGNTNYHMVDTNQSTHPVESIDGTDVEISLSDVTGISTDPYLSVTDVFLALRSDADDTDGGWTTDTGGSSLFAAIDEAVAVDSDFIRSEFSPSTDKCKIRLSNPGASVDTAKKHIIRYRYYKTPSDGQQINLIVRLVQGASTVIATWTHTNIIGNLLQAVQSLSGAEISNITDYDDLFLEFEANAP